MGANGTLAAPAWSFSADTTSGVFLSAIGIAGLISGNFGLLVNSKGGAALTATVAGGGGTYAVNDTITLAGGTFNRPTVLQVATISGSAVASVTILDPGLYTTTPTNPVSQASTSGSGSAATFNLTWSSTADLFSDQNGLAIWQELGATSYMAGAMNSINGLGLANYIGGANLAAAVSGSVPLPLPQGRLTSSSDTPVLFTDSISATEIYWAPYTGLWTPIHNGTTLTAYQLAGQLPLILSGAQTAVNIYDVFLAYNGGNPVIGLGPSWLAGIGGSITIGTCARGAGVGGTTLQRYLGFLVNVQPLTLYYNNGIINSTSNPLTVAINQGVYLGSVYIDGTSGQVSCYWSYGQARKWGIWNYFNRTPVTLSVGDPTSSWTYGTASVRESNGSTNNFSISFTGKPEEPIQVNFAQNVNFVGVSVTGNQTSSIGVGFNSPSSFSGNIGTFGASGSGSFETDQKVASSYTLLPGVFGINTFLCLELGNAASGSTWSFYGTQANMLLTTAWRA